MSLSIYESSGSQHQSSEGRTTHDCKECPLWRGKSDARLGVLGIEACEGNLSPRDCYFNHLSRATGVTAHTASILMDVSNKTRGQTEKYEAAISLLDDAQKMAYGWHERSDA